MTKLIKIIPKYRLESINISKKRRNTKKTTDEYKQELKVLRPNVEVLEEYINSQTSIFHLFKECGHKRKMRPSNVLNGAGCKECSDKNRGNYNRKSHKDFIIELKNINRKIEVIGTYVSSKTPIEVKCLICNHPWTPTPDSLLSGCGCPKCAGKIVTNEDFLKKFDKFGNINVRIISEYVNAKTKIKCLCLLCNKTFFSYSYQLINGDMCKKCSDIQKGLKLRKTHEEFVKEIEKINKNIKIIGKYNGALNCICCECIICGNTWSPSAENILQGHGCPVCNNSKGEKIINDFLHSKNILNINQYKFDNLVGLQNGLLSYDFYLPKYNLLIEYQGEQHERPIEYFGGKEKFKIQQEHDKRKREYAKEHNINLLEIWYYDIDNIEEILTNTLYNLKLESVETATPA